MANQPRKMSYDRRATEALEDRTDVLDEINFSTKRVADAMEKFSNAFRETGDRYIVVNDYRRKKMERDHRILHKRHLSTLECRPSENKCSCGDDHKAVAFFENGDLVEEMCPRKWWLAMQHLAFLDHRATEFVNELPLRIYLTMYEE